MAHHDGRVARPSRGFRLSASGQWDCNDTGASGSLQCLVQAYIEETQRFREFGRLDGSVRDKGWLEVGYRLGFLLTLALNDDRVVCRHRHTVLGGWGSLFGSGAVWAQVWRDGGDDCDCVLCRDMLFTLWVWRCVRPDESRKETCQSNNAAGHRSTEFLWARDSFTHILLM